MEKAKISKYILTAVVLFAAVLFIARSARPSILKLYIEAGMGDCRKIPLLCMSPSPESVTFNFNKEDGRIIELHPHKFPKVEISVPEGFTVVEEQIKKVSYKKKKYRDTGAIIYLFFEEPDFFVGLFPQLKKQGVNDDYEFIRRTMHADLGRIRDLTDAFFVIMKGIFLPDLGDQRNVRMSHFRIAGKRGFINYNLGSPDNYFDCNVFDDARNYFKIYIKDKGARLDLDSVLSIISMISKRG